MSTCRSPRSHLPPHGGPSASSRKGRGPRESPTPPGLARGLLALASAAVLGACDLPTEAPIFESRWIVPAEETSIGVAELLPSGVSVAGGGTAFAVSVSPSTVSRTLGEMCPACAPLNGLVVPKPAFQDVFESTATLPSDVVAATLAGGTVALTFNNELNFNFLNPGLGNTGTLTIRVLSGSREVGRLSLAGPQDSIPANRVSSRTLTLAPGALQPTLRVITEISSPQGGPTLIDTSERFQVTAAPSGLLVSEAQVSVAGRTVTADPEPMDVEDVSEDVLDKIKSGGVILEIANPFGVSVSFTLRIASGATTLVQKQLTVPADPVSTVGLQFTADELRSFLGKPDVTIGGSGTVTSTAGAVTVRPDQVVRIETKIDVTLRIP